MKEYLQSAVEVGGIARDAAKFILDDVLDIMAGTAAKVDQWLADYGDTDE